MTRVIAPYPSDTFDRLADLIALIIDAKAAKKYIEDMKESTAEMQAERLQNEKSIADLGAATEKAEKAVTKAETAAAKAEAEKEAAKAEMERLALARGKSSRIPPTWKAVALNWTNGIARLRAILMGSRPKRRLPKRKPRRMLLK